MTYTVDKWEEITNPAILSRIIDKYFLFRTKFVPNTKKPYRYKRLTGFGKLEESEFFGLSPSSWCIGQWKRCSTEKGMNQTIQAQFDHFKNKDDDR